MQNSNDLADIAKRCERVAGIIRRTGETGSKDDWKSVMNATKELEKYVIS